MGEKQNGRAAWPSRFVCVDCIARVKRIGVARGLPPGTRCPQACLCGCRSCGSYLSSTYRTSAREFVAGLQPAISSLTEDPGLCPGLGSRGPSVRWDKAVGVVIALSPWRYAGSRRALQVAVHRWRLIERGSPRSRAFRALTRRWVLPPPLSMVGMGLHSGRQDVPMRVLVPDRAMCPHLGRGFFLTPKDLGDISESSRNKKSAIAVLSDDALASSASSGYIATAHPLVHGNTGGAYGVGLEATA
ncbi:hypothetical protein Terro_4337 [Terriglobus roseus DSM 18391]|uniref:Uncharacterized protein n=1 Tax=Terriglobus roseus (strain DSM 18391 / NRRL B-41598 / KBS 63) TaxID=926566 RepID=I3ZMR6_TERRK|nr:hypothetical protein Terro_4337 [Terriglobus roseus DSM 18391]